MPVSNLLNAATSVMLATANVIGSDILRWYAQAHGDEARKPKAKAKWKMTFTWWQGNRRNGEWIRESISTSLTRTFERHTKGPGHTKQKRHIVKRVVEEIVYAHDVYRPLLEGENTARKSCWHRGARVWRD